MPRPASAEGLDLTDHAAVAAWIARVEQAQGPVAVLVNNVGSVLELKFQPTEKASFADWQAIFAVNLDAAFATTKMVVPGMKRAGIDMGATGKPRNL